MLLIALEREIVYVELYFFVFAVRRQLPCRGLPVFGIFALLRIAKLPLCQNRGFRPALPLVAAHLARAGCRAAYASVCVCSNLKNCRSVR